MNEKLKEYYHSDDFPIDVWLKKYRQEGENTPADMHVRLAKPFARVEFDYAKKEEIKAELSKFGQRLLERRKTQSLEDIENEIFGLFDQFKWISPQGSVMEMLGNKRIGSLSNCFVVGQPYDSYGGIFQKDQELVQLMKRRGGVGIDISTLRPAGTSVSNVAKTSTGAVSFMERYSNTTREVAQKGRRGALMLSIDVRHPDVLDFMNIKLDKTKVTGANISVMLRDDFMAAVEKDGDYVLRFPCNIEANIDEDEDLAQLPYNEMKTWSNCLVRKVKAKELFDTLVKNNWISAEPGSIFIDRHWDFSPDGVYKQYRGVTTNPCGEIFMGEYDACRLIALNFFSIVKDPFTKKAQIDYDRLYEVAYMQQRLGDDLVDLEIEAIDKIIAKIESDSEPEEVKRTELDLWKKVRKVAASGRRTGCGFSALGDMLAALGLKYDSEEGMATIDSVMRYKMLAELDATTDMAITRGAFDGWDSSMECYEKDGEWHGANSYYDFVRQEFEEQFHKMRMYGRRNVSFSTVAPVGSLSAIMKAIKYANLSSGMEPSFFPFYFRNRKVNPEDTGSRVDFVDQNGDAWMEYPVVMGAFRDWMEIVYAQDGLTLDIEAMTKEEMMEAYNNSPWYMSCAPDIDWVKRVQIQGIVQRYTSHSISSTINLPKDVKEEKIAEIYMAAWKHGLKGVTVYRDGSRTGVLVTESNKETTTTFDYRAAPKRPSSLPCDVYTITAKGKRWHVIVGLFDGKPYEVFAISHEHSEIPQRITSGELIKEGKGRYTLKSGKYSIANVTEGMSSEEEALTRMTSTALRHGADINFVVEQLNKSHGSVVSFNKAIARVLVKYAKKLADKKYTCSDCGSENVIFEEGCLKCRECGGSKCN